MTDAVAGAQVDGTSDHIPEKQRIRVVSSGVEQDFEHILILM